MNAKQYEQGRKDGAADAWSGRGERSLTGKTDSYIDGYDKGFDEASDEMGDNGFFDDHRDIALDTQGYSY